MNKEDSELYNSNVCVHNPYRYVDSVPQGLSCGRWPELGWGRVEVALYEGVVVDADTHLRRRGGIGIIVCVCGGGGGGWIGIVGEVGDIAIVCAYLVIKCSQNCVGS